MRVNLEDEAPYPMKISRVTRPKRRFLFNRFLALWLSLCLALPQVSDTVSLVSDTGLPLNTLRANQAVQSGLEEELATALEKPGTGYRGDTPPSQSAGSSAELKTGLEEGGGGSREKRNWAPGLMWSVLRDFYLREDFPMLKPQPQRQLSSILKALEVMWSAPKPECL